MIPVALNQPGFASDDFGDLGFWGEALTALVNTAINVGGQTFTNKLNSDNIKSQIAAQTAAAKDIAAFNAQQAIEVQNAAASIPVTSSPYFLPVVGVAAVAALLWFRK